MNDILSGKYSRQRSGRGTAPPNPQIVASSRSLSSLDASAFTRNDCARRLGCDSGISCANAGSLRRQTPLLESADLSQPDDIGLGLLGTIDNVLVLVPGAIQECENVPLLGH